MVAVSCHAGAVDGSVVPERQRVAAGGLPPSVAMSCRLDRLVTDHIALHDE